MGCLASVSCAPCRENDRDHGHRVDSVGCAIVAKPGGNNTIPSQRNNLASTDIEDSV